VPGLFEVEIRGEGEFGDLARGQIEDLQVVHGPVGVNQPRGVPCGAGSIPATEKTSWSGYSVRCGCLIIENWSVLGEQALSSVEAIVGRLATVWSNRGNGSAGNCNSPGKDSPRGGTVAGVRVHFHVCKLTQDVAPRITGPRA
jgi:hypothetical protein